MTLPTFSMQQPLFNRATRPSEWFTPDNHYRVFAEKIYARLAAAHPDFTACHCLANGRTAIEPVLLLGIIILQFLENTPDRPALELARLGAGCAFALNQARVAFVVILDGLRAASREYQEGKDALVKAINK